MTDHLLKSTKALIDALDEETRPKLRDFIAVLCHEMRTNVTGIEGFSNLLLEGKRGELSEEQKEAIHYIQKRAETIREIIDEFAQIITDLKKEMPKGGD
ncbi:MAG: histidine kinase dimerization/phospho-acceptor domain-containing protein [Candidatus Poribacteria bacterium]